MRTRPCVVMIPASLAAALCVAAGAQAQGVRALYTNLQASPTSLIPGGGGLRFNTGTTTQFDRPYVSANGQYFIFTAISNSGATATDEVVVVGSLSTGFITAANMVAREGITEIEPGRTIDSASIGRNAAINSMGQFVFQANLSGATTDDEVIVKGSNFMSPSLLVAVREGQSVGALAPTILLGATIDSPGIADNGKIGFRATLTGAPTGQTTAALFNDGATLAAQVGVTVPTGLMGPAATWQNIGIDDFYLNASGTGWLAAGDTNGATTQDGIIAVNNTVMIQEGFPLPGSMHPSTVSATIGEAIMAPGGAWMARGSFADTLDWVVYNGTPVSITGNTVPGGLPGETFDQAIFTATYFALAANGVGDYVYGGVTNAADVNANAVIVWNNLMVVAREGDPVDIDGNGLYDDDAFISVFNNDDMFLTDDNFLYFFADLRDGAGATIGQAFLVLQVPTPGAAAFFGFAALALRRRRD